MPKKQPSHATPRGTAGRVPRNTLSRAVVVDAALQLIDEEGLEAITMPKVAQRLGVGTMSLYRHVRDKEDLIEAVATQVMSSIQVPAGAPDDWEGRVVGYLRELRDAAIAHPALGRILADRGLTVGPVFDQLEQLLGILVAAGFTKTDAVRTFYTLLSYVFGFVIWELPRVHQQPAAAYTTAWNDAIDSLDRHAYPQLHALRRTLTTTASPDQFEYGLRRLLVSVRHTHPRAN
jgi:TetR/AcrR family transcriptional regulator, tetracycline repressor protein